jgi:4-amino-4-deoxy-L-arabinose transferase-like glycosyltransferase
MPTPSSPAANSDTLGRMPELLLVLGLSAALKVFVALNDVVVNADAVLFLAAARELASGHLAEGLAICPLPAYSALIAAVQQLIPDGVLAARALNVAASVLTLIPICLLTSDLFGRRAAFWAGIALALCPQHNEMAIEVIRDPLYILCVAWAACLMARGLLHRRRWPLAAGLLCAWLAVLFRAEGLILLAVSLGLLLAAGCFWRDHRRLAFEALGWGALPALAGVGMLLGGFWPQGLTNRLDEVWLRIQDWRNLAFLDNYDRIYDALKLAESQASKVGAEFFGIARRHIAVIYLLGLLGDLARALFPVYLLPLLAGLRARVPRPLGWGLLVLAGAQMLTGYISLLQIDYLSARHLMPAAVLLFPWVGRGTEALVNWMLERRWGLVAAPLVVALLFAVPAFKSGAAPRREDRAIARTGTWLQEHSELQEARLATNDWRLHLYIDREAPYAAMRALTKTLDQHYRRSEFAALEEAVLAAGKTLLTLTGRHQSPDPGPVFRRFQKIGEVADRRNVVRIYAEPELAEKFQAGALND